MAVVTLLGRTFEVSDTADEVLVRPVRELLDHVLRYLSAGAARRFLEIYAEADARRRYVVARDFQRHSADHRLYRELRHSLLIMPRGGGQWEPGTEVQVCVLAHMLFAHAAPVLQAKAVDGREA